MSAIDDRLHSLPRIQAEPPASRRAMATVVELEEKLTTAQDRLEAIRLERDQYSFDAATTRGQSPARRHLEKLLAEHSAIEGEILVLQSALKTAELRLADARARSKQSAAVDEANRAIELCATLRAEGMACGDALTSLGIHYRGFEKAMDELRRLGYGPAQSRLAKLAVERAIGTALAGLNLSPTPALSPGQRTSMAAVAESYAASAETTARRVNGGKGEAA